MTVDSVSACAKECVCLLLPYRSSIYHESIGLFSTRVYATPGHSPVTTMTSRFHFCVALPFPSDTWSHSRSPRWLISTTTRCVAVPLSKPRGGGSITCLLPTKPLAPSICGGRAS